MKYHFWSEFTNLTVEEQFRSYVMSSSGGTRVNVGYEPSRGETVSKLMYKPTNRPAVSKLRNKPHCGAAVSELPCSEATFGC